MNGLLKKAHAPHIAYDIATLRKLQARAHPGAAKEHSPNPQECDHAHGINPSHMSGVKKNWLLSGTARQGQGKQSIHGAMIQ
jgi:hypothetical protein